MKSIRLLFSALFAAMCYMGIGAQNTTSHNFEVMKQLDIFNSIYKNLDLMFVDTLNAGQVIGNAVKGMLSQMDPYTEYFPTENAYKKGMTGAYAGMGATVHYSFTKKCVVVDEPFEDSPAAKAGLKKGDVIVAVDNEKMEGKELSYVTSHLRGEAGTTFLLKIRRGDKVMKKKITRATITQVPTILASEIRDGDVGYLYLTSFVEGGCAKEVRHAMAKMKADGARSFVLDLRSNGGGLVNEAVDVVNIFVPKHTEIVNTKGKLPQASSSYSTTMEPLDTICPVVVLVNKNSASASEIVAGSLQDLDRAVIIGQRTFGKGLVQRPIDLPYGGNLKLTVGKYYIPSGRCIQELSYNRTDKARFEKDEIPDSLTHAFLTRGGRMVRDGRGIMPDIKTEPDTISNLAFYLSEVVDSTDTFFDWVCNYCASHPQVALPTEFELTDADYEDFCTRCIDNGFKMSSFTSEVLKKLKEAAKAEGYLEDVNGEITAMENKLKHNLRAELMKYKDDIKELLGSQIMTYFYGHRGAFRFRLRYDKDLAEAIRLLHSEDEYKKLLTPKD